MEGAALSSRSLGYLLSNGVCLRRAYPPVAKQATAEQSREATGLQAVEHSAQLLQGIILVQPEDTGPAGRPGQSPVPGEQNPALIGGTLGQPRVGIPLVVPGVEA